MVVRSKTTMSIKKRQLKLKKAIELSNPEKLVPWYSKKYKVPIHVAEEQLSDLGYYEEVRIESYERSGMEWEYMYDGYSGAMKVVPKGTEEWELHEY